jgi:hypothetical protein
MFEGLIYKEDAVDLLKDATKTKKASILNFGGNCAEGKWNMVQALHPFADYIFASDLLVYGVKGIPRDKVGPYIALSKKEDELNNIKVQMDKRAGILDAAKALLASRRKIWEFVKETIGRTKLKQSKSLYKSSEFPALKAYLIKRWNVLSPLKRDEVIFQTEEAMCDTQVFAKGLGGDEADKLFKAFRIGYIDTSDFFKWDVPTRGLSFNFLGFKQPPCDIKVFGAGGDVQNCKVQSTPFSAAGATVGCDSYRQGEVNHKKCAVHVDKTTGNKATAVCKECGVCMPELKPCKKQLWEGNPRPFVGPKGNCQYYKKHPSRCRNTPEDKDLWSKDPVTGTCPECGQCSDKPVKKAEPEQKKTEPEQKPAERQVVKPQPIQPIQRKKIVPVAKKEKTESDVEKEMKELEEQMKKDEELKKKLSEDQSPPKKSRRRKGGSRRRRRGSSPPKSRRRRRGSSSDSTSKRRRRRSGSKSRRRRRGSSRSRKFSKRSSMMQTQEQ